MPWRASLRSRWRRFSFVLPHTPPKKSGNGAEKFAWLEALKLLKHPFVLVLWLVTLVDSFVHNCYFNWTGSFLGTATAAGGVGIPGNWIMPVMSVGQIAEMLTMFILGATLKRLGWRATMIVGILGHVARFAVYAYFPAAQGAHHRGADPPRHLLRVFLRHGLYFCRRVFPEGCAGERAGLVQRDGSRRSARCWPIPSARFSARKCSRMTA